MALAFQSLALQNFLYSCLWLAVFLQLLERGFYLPLACLGGIKPLTIPPSIDPLPLLYKSPIMGYRFYTPSIDRTALGRLSGFFSAFNQSLPLGLCPLPYKRNTHVPVFCP